MMNDTEISMRGIQEAWSITVLRKPIGEYRLWRKRTAKIRFEFLQDDRYIVQMQVNCVQLVENLR